MLLTVEYIKSTLLTSQRVGEAQVYSSHFHYG